MGSSIGGTSPNMQSNNKNTSLPETPAPVTPAPAKTQPQTQPQTKPPMEDEGAEEHDDDIGPGHGDNGLGHGDNGSGDVINGSGDFNNGSGDVNNGSGDGDNGSGDVNNGSGDGDKGSGDGDNGSGDVNNGSGDGDNGSGDVNNGSGDGDKGSGDGDKGSGDGDKGSGDGDNGSSDDKPKTKTLEEMQAEARLDNEKHAAMFQQTSSIQRKTEDGDLYTLEFIEHISSVGHTHTSFEKYCLSVNTEGQLKTLKSFLESDSLSVVCDIITDELKTRAFMSENTDVAQNHSRVLRLSILTLVNYTDLGDEVSFYVREHRTVLPAILQLIKDWTSPHMDGKLSNVEMFLLKDSMALLHNMGSRDNNMARLRELGTSEILMPFLKSADAAIKMYAYAALADIISEEEADKLSAEPELAKFLLRRLDTALKAEDHRGDLWSVTEIVRAVHHLSRNDANKKLMVEVGVIPLLTKGVKSELDEEKNECMETTWMLSFHPKNIPEIMKNEELMDVIVSAAHDRSQPEKFRHAAQGILFQMREELINCKTKKYAAAGKEIFENMHKKKSGAASPGKSKPDQVKERHVMLSYQWADQVVVKQIRDVIRKEGYKVWMDVDYMAGSTLEAMAAAIQDAFVVVMAMSQKYKDSPNCRAEAEYSFQQRKKIIPLITLQGYRPDGWLGIILGAKLYYPFSDTCTFESSVKGLLNEVADSAGDTTDGDTHIKAVVVNSPEAAVVAVAAQPVFHAPPVSRTARNIDSTMVNGWSSTDIKNWLKKFQLDGKEMERLTGKEVVFLHNLRTEAPEFFYSTLRTDLKIKTLSGLMSFTDALDDLGPVARHVVSG